METSRATQNHQAAYNDEIDLISIFVFFLRNLKVIILITALFGLVGLTAAMILPRSYTYATAIEIGKIAQENASKQIDFKQIITADEVVETLNIAIIPLVLNEYLEAVNTNIFIEIKAAVDKKANIVTLKSKGTLKVEETHKKLHHQIAEILIKGHQQQYIMPIQSALIASVKQSELTLAQAQDEKILNVKMGFLKLKSQNNQVELQRLQQEQGQINSNINQLLPAKKQLLERRRETLQEQLAKVTDSINKMQPLATAVDQDASSTTSMVDQLKSQRLQNLLNQQSALKEELTTRLELEKTMLNQEENRLKDKLQEIKSAQSFLNNSITLIHDEVDKLILETKLEVALQVQDVLKKQALAEHLIPTQIISQPSASIKPTGRSRALILALSIIIGGFLAVFIVLLKEILTSAKRQLLDK